MQKLKALIADDEPHALRLVASYIEQVPYLSLVGTCKNAYEVLDVLKDEKVDVAFLDIQMPNLNGIELAQHIGGETKIVFTTAFEEYAIQGYKVKAVDYLLKPFDLIEFMDVAARVREIINHEILSQRESAPENQYLYVKADYKLVQILLKDITYIEGLKDYLRFYFDSGQNPIMTLMSMKALEEKLDPKKFMRVHRSFIINLEKIKVVERNRIVFDKNYIPVSEKYRSQFQQHLNSLSAQ